MNRFVVAGLAAVALSGSALVAASAADGGGQGPALRGSHRVTVTSCDGGAQKQVKNRIVDEPFVFGETNAFVNVPGAGVSIGGPSTGTDTLVITFSAETQLQGTTENNDWLGLRVLVDGNPIEPYDASGSVLAITGSPTFDAHSVTFCTKIGAGNHSVQAQVNTADFGAGNSLTGWIDDYTLSVEKSN